MTKIARWLHNRGFYWRQDNFLIVLLLPDAIASVVGSLGFAKCELCGKGRLFYAGPSAVGNQHATMPGWEEFQARHKLIAESAFLAPSLVERKNS